MDVQNVQIYCWDLGLDTWFSNPIQRHGPRLKHHVYLVQIACLSHGPGGQRGPAGWGWFVLGVMKLSTSVYRRITLWWNRGGVLCLKSKWCFCNSKKDTTTKLHHKLTNTQQNLTNQHLPVSQLDPKILMNCFHPGNGCTLNWKVPRNIRLKIKYNMCFFVQKISGGLERFCLCL